VQNRGAAQPPFLPKTEQQQPVEGRSNRWRRGAATTDGRTSSRGRPRRAAEDRARRVANGRNSATRRGRRRWRSRKEAATGHSGTSGSAGMRMDGSWKKVHDGADRRRRAGGWTAAAAKTSTRRPAATGSAPADSRRPPDDRRRS